MSQNELLTKIANRLNKYVNSVEVILLALLFPVLLLHFFTSLPVFPIVMILSSLLGILYFIIAFAQDENKPMSAIEFFFHKLSHIGFAIAINGSIFTIMNIHGGRIMLFSALLSMAASLLYLLFVKIKVPDTYSFLLRSFIRLVVLLSISVILFLFPDII
ncbi:MAG: hypothetical protein KBA86_06945 [Bacteroidales bacterium]|nr:hypothetical protein [Bacteroidales bacterium]